MDVRWKKVLRDLTLRRARVTITLVGLVIGLSGIGSVLVAQRILEADLAANFSRTVPPHLIVPMRGLDAAMLDAVRDLEGVVAAENRPVIAARLAIGPDRFLPLMLFVVDDFESMAIARVFPDYGAYPPPTGGVLLERDGRPLIRIMGGQSADVGAELALRLSDGTTIRAPLAGSVFDPGQAPSRMEMMIYGYVERDTASAWMPAGFEDRLLVRAAGALEDPADRRALRDAVGELIATRGGQAFDLVLPVPNEHPHQFQMNTILTLLLGLGVLGFVLSAVLVTNLVTVLLTNQIREIGTLKAIGASVVQVRFLYLGSMLLLGLAASLLALPLALRAGFALANVMAMMLNFELLTQRLPVGFLASLVLVGSLFPVVAAFVPVRRWSAVPVRAALDNHGVAAVPEVGAAMSRVLRVLPLTVRLGVRNALRVPRRSLLSALTLAVGAVVFLLAMNLRASLVHTADVEDARWHHDLTVRLAASVTRDALTWIEQLPWARSIELWDSASTELLLSPRHGSPRFSLIAVPADTTVFSPDLATGRWPLPGDAVGVVVSHRFTSHYPDLTLGDRFDAKVAGRVVSLVLLGTAKVFGPAALYMDAEGYRAMAGAPEGQGRLLFVSREPDADIGLGDMQSALESRFEAQGAQVSGMMPSQMATRIIRNHLLVIEAMLGFVAVIMLLVSGLGLATGISTSVVERTRELGVMRAIGAGTGAIYQILAAEAVFVALCAWLAAVAVATMLGRPLNDWFGIGVVEYPFDYATSLLGVALSFGAMVVLALLATAGPVRAISRRAVSEAIDYE